MTRTRLRPFRQGFVWSALIVSLACFLPASDLGSSSVGVKPLEAIGVVPLTSSTTKLYPCEAYLSLGNQTAKAMADQLTTVSKKRLRNRIGLLSPEDMDSIERIIRLQLDLA